MNSRNLISFIYLTLLVFCFMHIKTALTLSIRGGGDCPPGTEYCCISIGCGQTACSCFSYKDCGDANAKPDCPP